MILEFRNLQMLSHPNIVQMYEIYISWNEGFQAAGTVCIVMEKIEGKEMFEVIQSCGHYDGTFTPYFYIIRDQRKDAFFLSSFCDSLSA